MENDLKKYMNKLNNEIEKINENKTVKWIILMFLPLLQYMGF